MVLDGKEQQPSQLGAQEVHKTVKDNFLVYMKAELMGNLPEIVYSVWISLGNGKITYE